MSDRVAAFIVSYNMPERADALADYLKANVAWPMDLYLIDNGSDIAEPARNTNVRLPRNCQTTNGWLRGMAAADLVRRDYFAYWFLITSAEFIPGSGDPLAPLAQWLVDEPNAVGVHPALTEDSTTVWKYLITQGGDQPRRVHHIDVIASLFRADWFDGIGRFDPQLYMAHGICLETCWFARKQGRSIWIHEGSHVKKVTDIGYTMKRMNISAEQRLTLARINMDCVLGMRYGSGYWERLQHEYRDGF